MVVLLKDIDLRQKNNSIYEKNKRKYDSIIIMS